MKGKKPKTTEPNPTCACCNEREGDGSVYITFDPYDQQRLDPTDRFSSNHIDRGFKLSLPMCKPCLRASFKLDVKIDIKNNNGWGTTT